MNTKVHKTIEIMTDFPRISASVLSSGIDGYHQFMSDNLEASLYEKDLYDNLGSIIRNQQFITVQQAIQILKWRAPAEPGHIRKNDPERVKLISRQSLAQKDDEIKIHILTLIKGIAIPTASKILSITTPSKYLTLNRMSWKVLSRWGYLDGHYSVTNQSWMKFLKASQSVMSHYQVDGRSLDQALIAIYLEHEQQVNLQKFIPLDQFF